MKKLKECSKEEIKLAITSNKNLGLVCSQLQCTDNTYNRSKLKEFIKLNDLDISHFVTRLSLESYNKNPKICKNCGKVISYEQRENSFCSRSCATSYTKRDIRNGSPLPTHSYCLNCGKEITRGTKYCNNKCQSLYKHNEYIKRWKEGLESGCKGSDDVSNHIRRYLLGRYNNSCQKCGWSQVNLFTGLVPLLIHHIDGNCLNNKEENLLLLCPNCHALTENFGSRNTNCTRIDKRIR